MLLRRPGRLSTYYSLNHCCSKGGSASKGGFGGSFVKEAFMKTCLSEEEAPKWASYFIDVRKSLHGDCFYGLIYKEEEDRSLMEKAREYVDLVDKILKKLEYQHSKP
jgi:hypothetical protein